MKATKEWTHTEQRKGEFKKGLNWTGRLGELGRSGRVVKR